MESRKVQITGGSTFTVSIPKTWATEQGIEVGSEVEFHQEGDHLLLAPKQTGKRTEGIVDISDLDETWLNSTVLTMYVSGFDTITLESDTISTEERRTIREMVQRLVGVEILEETTHSIVIRDLMDSSELSIDNAVTRMQLIALSMLEDAVQALLENDTELAKSVIQRDDDVDRLWFAVSRIVRGTLRSPPVTGDLGVPREICFDYRSCARQFERLADQSVTISNLSMNIGDVDADLTEAIEALHNSAVDIIETGMQGMLEEEQEKTMMLAHRAREAIPQLNDHRIQIDDLLRELDPHEAQHLGRLVDSLSRTADYGGNIAEIALQKSAPKP